MNDNDRKKLKDRLCLEEGFRRYPYKDTLGRLTIGYGRNLQNRGITIQEALVLLEFDIIYFETELEKHLACYSALDAIRKIVLVDMCFNMGLRSLLGFKKMIKALGEKDYHLASIEMINSRWATQVGHRAVKLSESMKYGILVNYE